MDKAEVYDFGLRLKQLRKKAKLTQKEVASRLEIAKNNISRYENNVQAPTIDTLKTLAVLYNTSTDYLLGLTDRKPLFTSDMPESEQMFIENSVDFLKKELAKMNGNK